jgi:fimbrial chaperone protein
MRLLAWITTLAASLAVLPPAEAASLRVSPVLLDMKAPQAASSISVWNDAKEPINVQVRVFRWSQKDGADVYTPATDVVASPPITTLKPGGENIVRIVRTTKQAIQSEESYRLIVDELPDPARRQTGTITLVLRHSIPVFFSRPEPAAATPEWKVQQKPGGFQVTVTNSGAKRLKISNLSLAGGKTPLAKRDGLVGYALGKSTASWFVPATPGGRLAGRSVTISADSEAGRFDATASVSGG